MTEITFNKSDFNDCYLSHLDNPSRFLVFYGGAGSGKSVFIAQRYVYRCLSEPYFRLVYCRKVANTIRNSQFQLFKDLITRSGLDQFFHIKEGNMEIECSNGNKLIAFGLDNREKIKSIQEPTDIWAEEMNEFDEEDISQLLLRLRTKKAKYNQLVGSFNPISTEHWIYDALIVSKRFNCEMVKSTYKDNKFLPDTYKAYLESLKDTNENFYKVYCLGEWGGAIKGLIYTKWQLCDHVPQFATYIYGLDFGFNDPAALVKIGVVDKRFVYVQQLIFKTGLTNTDLIKEMQKFNIGKDPIYADSARPEAIEEIYRAGFNIKKADKGKDSVQNGIDFVCSLNLNIMNDSPDLIKEINNYRWMEDKNGKMIEGKPVDFMDHLLDAMRYALHTHISRPQGAFRISAI
jgi:phage terminase large subunit